MSKKKKTKLSSDQKRRLNCLKSLQDDGSLVTDQDLKDLVQDGEYAVLSIRAPIFATVICTDSEESARIIADKNYSSFTRIVDMRKGETVVEINRPWIPMARDKF